MTKVLALSANELRAMLGEGLEAWPPGCFANWRRASAAVTVACQKRKSQGESEKEGRSEQLKEEGRRVRDAETETKMKTKPDM
eukprot:549757-Pleurochrysis_carterae.AAC.1